MRHGSEDWRLASPEYDSQLVASAEKVFHNYGIRAKPRVVIYKRGEEVNAFFNYNTPNTMFISSELLRRFTPEEVEATMAHEVGHRVQRHFTHVINYVHKGLALLGGVALTAWAQKTLSHFVENTLPQNLDVGQKTGAFFKRAGEFIKTHPLSAVVIFSAVSGTVHQILQYPKAAIQRMKEAQADRLAVEHGANPAAMLTKFQKYEGIQKERREKRQSRYIPATDAGKEGADLHRPKHQSGELSGWRKELRELKRTHPTLEERKTFARSRLKPQQQEAAKEETQPTATPLMR